MADWKDNLLEDDGRVGELLRGAKRVAVLGVKTEAQPDQAAFYVASFLADHGAGVQHVSIEVLNAGYARACLDSSGAPLLTEVAVDADGHEQFFAADDPAAGVQLGFISRIGHRVGVGTENVLTMFDAMVRR